MLDESKLKEAVLNSIGEGVFTVDKDFKINYFNKAAERITGFAKEEVLGKFCKHIFKSSLCFSDCPIGLVLKAGKSIFDFETCIQSKDGKKIQVKLNSSILKNEDSEPEGGIITFRDITEFAELKKDLEARNNYFGIIGHSKLMLDVFELIDEIADSDAPVFIHGESGTGKELIANAIQMKSNRADKPFIKVNCSVFPANLLASELFGHVKGAFTDAIKDRPGRFELANKGTLFLDEVTEMPLNMQLQILRVLQEGTFERIGDSSTKKVDVRIIASTNINFTEAIKTGKFREDLFYRLNVIPIGLPPLRERKEDIPFLIKHFLLKFSVNYKKNICEIEDNALETLLYYSYPGNVRELENILEYSFVRTSENGFISTLKLPPYLKNITLPDRPHIRHQPSRSEELISIITLLEKNKWNKAKTAKELGIGRTTLWRKIKESGL